MNRPALLLVATVVAGTLACGGLDEDEPTGDADPAPAATAEAPARPEAPAPPPAAPAANLYGKPAFAVILWGSPDKAAADAWLAKYAAAGGPKHSPWPAVVDSTTVALLKPGFQVVIAAETDDAAAAEDLRSRFRTYPLAGVDLSGAYVREIRAESPEHVDPRAIVPPAWRAVAVCNPLRVNGEIPETSEDWGWFTADVGTSVKAVGFDDADCGDGPIVQVTRAGKPIGKVDVAAIRDGARCGYVLTEQGKDPAWVRHDMVDSVLKQASAYFGVAIAAKQVH